VAGSGSAIVRGMSLLISIDDALAMVHSAMVP
jgi:hypothetical protein